MTEEAEELEVSDLSEDLDNSLTALQSSLAQASQSVAAIRTHISQVGILVDMVREMEAAMTLARQNLSTRSDLDSRAPQPASQVAASPETTDEPVQADPAHPSHVPSSDHASEVGEPEMAPSDVEPGTQEPGAVPEVVTPTVDEPLVEASEAETAPSEPAAAPAELETEAGQPAEIAATVDEPMAEASEAETAPSQPAAATAERETETEQPAEITATVDEPVAEASEAETAPSQPAAATAEREMETEQMIAAPAPETEEEGPTATSAQPDPPRPISHRLRMGVSSNAGSLDLRAVDGAVNENPAVVDVALLDYDGRHATLKLWISGAADPQTVRESLIASLRDRLGDQQETELRVDFELAAA